KNPVGCRRSSGELYLCTKQTIGCAAAQREYPIVGGAANGNHRASVEVETSIRDRSKLAETDIPNSLHDCIGGRGGVVEYHGTAVVHKTGAASRGSVE